MRARATRRVVTEDEERHLAIVAFTMGADYRLEVPLPFVDPRKKGAPDGAPSSWWRMSAAQREAWQAQRVRSRWRAVVLLVKSKLELVEIGASTIEKEFLADLVLPGGGRLHDALAERLVATFNSGGRVPLLGPGPSASSSPADKAGDHECG